MGILYLMQVLRDHNLVTVKDITDYKGSSDILDFLLSLRVYCSKLVEPGIYLKVNIRRLRT